MLENDKSLKYYSFFVKCNPFVQYTEWDKITEKAQKYFVDFLNEKDYGDGIMATTFYFFIEKEIDLNKQHDNISTGSYFGISKSARLNLHFDYDFFIKTTEENKYKMILNGILYLLKYWHDNLKVPKENTLKEIIDDFRIKLQKDKFFTENIEQHITKFSNKFRFYFMKHTIYGLKEKHILFEINDIEKHLNNNLYKYDFGQSVKELYFSYDIFDFDNKGHQQYFNQDKDYGYGKRKDLIIVEKYDCKLLFEKTKLEQLEYFHKGLLKSIERIAEMKRKPKDFNHIMFLDVIDKLMKEYIEKFV